MASLLRRPPVWMGVSTTPSCSWRGGDLHEVITNGQKDSAKIRERLEAAGYTGQRLKDLLWQIEPTRLTHRLVPATTWLYSARQDQVVPLKNAELLAKVRSAGCRSPLVVLGEPLYRHRFLPRRVGAHGGACREVRRNGWTLRALTSKRGSRATLSFILSTRSCWEFPQVRPRLQLGIRQSLPPRGRRRPSTPHGLRGSQRSKVVARRVQNRPVRG